MTIDTVPMPLTDEEIAELLADIEKDEQGVPLMDAEELKNWLSGTNGRKVAPRVTQIRRPAV
jgi:hypothetical protein